MGSNLLHDVRNRRDPPRRLWSERWGTVRVYTVSCLGFLAASLLTAAANNLEMLVLGRSLQGFLGGALLPTVFSFAFSALPAERRAPASLMPSLAATLAPTLGPAVGGYITELSNWRWLFLMNVPPGLVSLSIIHLLGRAEFAPRDPSARFDRVGLVLLGLLLVGLLYVLEEGTRPPALDPARAWVRAGLRFRHALRGRCRLPAD